MSTTADPTSGGDLSTTADPTSGLAATPPPRADDPAPVKALSGAPQDAPTAKASESPAASTGEPAKRSKHRQREDAEANRLIRAAIEQFDAQIMRIEQERRG